MPEIPRSKPGMLTAFDTILEADASEEDFLAATQGVQEREDINSATSASRKAAVDLNEVAEVHNERSRRSRMMDENRLATITTDPDEWRSDPANFDFPGIDTPADHTFDF